ncbi:hypothetical protein AncyloWKF20_07620 [Ancylobacter sp. WKF20]|uniref:hypothetical protein n=1 Tax=Ancylobacter sp. WKF20 TaxID=3039801 RepID=UPI0024344A11|nr:hypothetical protein [Ancylobacter sp. WKF20]WGD31678.1 hypothetical protein AncyloWKF20_07620 [Ancylobacter sp. WKF20]
MMEKLAVFLGAAAAAFAAAFLVFLIGGVFWMLAIKLIAWLIGATLSWPAALGWGLATALLMRVLRGRR